MHKDVKRPRLTSCHALSGSLKTRLHSVSHQTHSNFSNATRFGMRWWNDGRPLASYFQNVHEPTLFHSDLELERQGWTFRRRLVAGATVPSKMFLVRKRHLFDVIWTSPKDLAMLQECLCHLAHLRVSNYKSLSRPQKFIKGAAITMLHNRNTVFWYWD